MSIRINTDVLIIGSGIAGLSVALSLSEKMNVLLVTKNKISDCSTSWAQGGIAAVRSKSDSITEHINDTIINGHGICDNKVVDEIITQGPSSILWLEKNGINFIGFEINTDYINIANERLENIEN